MTKPFQILEEEEAEEEAEEEEEGNYKESRGRLPARAMPRRREGTREESRADM